jgi:hypothetical protein
MAAGQYCYAVMAKSKRVYSWGMGENYVLGNRDDCNQFTPYLLDPRMFDENPVQMMACGTMHAVALSLDSPDGKIPELDKTIFAEIMPKRPVSKEATPAKTVPETVADDVKS